MKKILLVLMLVMTNLLSFSKNLMEQFKDAVVFTYLDSNGCPTSANGSGFLLAIPSSLYKDGKYIYFVTAKHTLIKNGRAEKTIWMQLNSKDSKAFFKADLIWTGTNKTVFLHKDESVDIAVIPVIIPSNIQYTNYDLTHIVKKKDFDSLSISYGTEVFFTGLFTGYSGKNKMMPIYRFGRICLIPDSKIPFNGTEMDLTLVESFSFGGNSGSPVVFKTNKAGVDFYFLGGVMTGSYSQLQNIAPLKIDITTSNMGVAAITPSEYILDIIEEKSLAEKRK